MSPTQRLLTYVHVELLGGRDDDVGSDDDLLGSGLVDSLGVVQLVQYIEEAFDIVVPVEDVTIENFGCVDDIVDYLVSDHGLDA